MLTIIWKRSAKSGSKPEGCHAKEGAEPEQPVQAPEEPVSVSSCGRVDPLEEKFASWIGQQDRPFPSHEWLEDWSRARCDEMSQWAVLVTALQARVRRMACVSSSAVSGEPSWSVTCEQWKDANSWNS